MHLDFPYLVTEEALACFVEGFEQCTLPKQSWTHAAHVTVATVYLLQDRLGALSRIRTNIRRFNESVGGINSDTSGYHETLTVFWLNVIDKHIDRTVGPPVLDKVSKVVEAFGFDSKLHEKFYTYDVLNCTEARRAWMAPDAATAPFPLACYITK